MDDWMINLGIAAGGAIFAYGLLRGSVSALKDEVKVLKEESTAYAHREALASLKTDIKEHIAKDDETHFKASSRIDAGFKKLDRVIERVTVLERDTSTHLTLPKAEEKFVSKQELELHLKNIELTATHTNKMVDKMSGKLEDVLSALSIKFRTVKED